MSRHVMVHKVAKTLAHKVAKEKHTRSHKVRTRSGYIYGYGTKICANRHIYIYIYIYTYIYIYIYTRGCLSL